MNTTTTDLHAAVRTQAETIVTSGADIRPRLADAVAQAASQPGHSQEGLLGLVRAVIAGAKEGLERSVPDDREDVLRQVVDALGDGLSRTALAGQLALEEAVSSSRKYTQEDLARLGNDLAAVRSLFAETVAQGLRTGQALTTGQVSTAMSHARRVAEQLGPVFTRVLDAVRRHPVVLAREGFQAGISVGQCATGSFFDALGRMLQRAGDELRREPRTDR